MAQKVYIYIENGIYNVLYILIYKIGSHGHSKQTRNHLILIAWLLGNKFFKYFLVKEQIKWFFLYETSMYVKIGTVLTWFLFLMPNYACKTSVSQVNMECNPQCS